MFELYYTKNKNSGIFSYLEQKDSYESISNYVPIYNMIFNLNDTNWNSINLNNDLYLSSIIDKKSDNIYNIEVTQKLSDIEDSSIKTKKSIVPTFVKLAPLFDPVKFMVGKYKDISYNDLYSVPTFNDNSQFQKSDYITYRTDKNDAKKTTMREEYINDKKQSPYNSSYIDGFFSYLTSKLYNNDHFIHGLQFYGSYNGIKHDFNVNVADDIEYLQESEYFFKHSNDLFTIDEDHKREIMNFETRKNKEKLDFSNTKYNITLDNSDDLDISEIFNERKNDCDVSTNSLQDDAMIYCNEELTNNEKGDNKSNTESSYSSCSSRVSNVSHDSEDNDCDEGEEQEQESLEDQLEKLISSNVITSDSDESGSMCSIDSDESVIINVGIKKFPVHMIFLEKMESTLDQHMMNNEISVNEWKSILFQIIIQLYTYQKLFQFTHNDLHTNNIMYQPTEKKHIIYHIDSHYYKVPTYGKIYKIIDFGRAVYSFKGKRYCSDSYEKNGDAHTQYNCEPFFNGNKRE